MTKKNYTILMLLGILIASIITSCKKTAAFSTDKQEYMFGETVKATNNSERGEDYIWTSTGLDEEVRTRDLQYVANKSGRHAITLALMSKKDKVVNEVTQVIYVKAQFLFYTQSSLFEGAELTIDGVYAGKITQIYPLAEPNCGATGCITKVLTDGEHQFFIKLASGSYSYTDYIYATDVCNKILLN